MYISYYYRFAKDKIYQRFNFNINYTILNFLQQFCGFVLFLGFHFYCDERVGGRRVTAGRYIGTVDKGYWVCGIFSLPNSKHFTL